MDELAALLHRERLLLEKLLFKLVVLRQLLTGGEARFLPWAAQEVDHQTSRLRESELYRAIVVNRIAERAGIDESALSLRALAGTAPEPYGSIFTDHRRAMRELSAEINDALAACRTGAAQGAAFVGEVLERVRVESDRGLAVQSQPGAHVAAANT